MRFNYNRLPEEMKCEKRWVLWKLKPMGEKQTKIPINALNGYGAKSNDSSTWVDFDTALNNCDLYKCDGLGFMLGSGWFGVDIDHTMNDMSLVDEFTNTLQSYTEISQSGEGIHIICKGVLPKGMRRKGNIEMYDNARFFAITGIVVNDYLQVRECTESIKELYSKYLPSSEVNINNNAITNSILSDVEVVSKASASSNGNLFSCLYYGNWEGLYPSQSEADMAFCNLLAFWCGRDFLQIDRIFRESKLYREKWDIKRGELTYGEMTIKTAINNCRDTYTSEFNNTKTFNIKSGEVEEKKKYDLSDTGNAQRFVDNFGKNIRYNFDNKCWVYFNGKTWIKDTKQVVKTKVDVLIEQLKKEWLKNNDKDFFKNIMHLSNNSGKEAMLKEAMHLGNTPVVNADFDKHMYLLNCNNGVINLKNGELLAHNRDYMLSKNTNIDVDIVNEPTRWVKFLYEIFNNNEEMVNYIQEALGYTLTGDTREQCFFQCYGEGANGKSVFLDIVYEMLGDYAINSQVESILAKNNGGSGASSEIARMAGARFVRTNEPNETARFNEGLVKQLVSGDITTARYLYGNEFEFKPVFKLWIATNYKIKVRGTDYGIWRRQRLVPFEVKFEGEKADKHLLEKLREELPQILGWCVKGAIKWLNKGLETPNMILEANNQYKKEMDIIAQWSESNLIINPHCREKAGDVYKDYVSWAKLGNEYCMTNSKFGVELAKKFEKKNVGGYVYYIGIQLKKNDERYIFNKE